MSEKQIEAAAAILCGALPEVKLGPEGGAIGYPTDLQVAIELERMGMPYHFDPFGNRMPLTATLAIVFLHEVKLDRLGRARHYPVAVIERKDTEGKLHRYGPCKWLSHRGFFTHLWHALDDDRDHLCQYTAHDPYAKEAA